METSCLLFCAHNPLGRTKDVAPLTCRGTGNVRSTGVPVSHKWLCFVATVRTTYQSEKHILDKAEKNSAFVAFLQTMCALAKVSGKSKSPSFLFLRATG